MRRHSVWLLVMILIGLLAAWAFPAAGLAAPKGPTVAPLPRARAGLAPAATATFFIAHPGGAGRPQVTRFPRGRRVCHLRGVDARC